MDNKNCVMTDQYKRIQGAKLKIQNKTFTVYKGVNTIGRNKAATINLKNVNVSQHQAVIIIVDDTQHFISDLNSSNGTYLLGAKLAPFKLYELSNEMEIKFGDETASYLKMPNLSTTVHLEMEAMEMTQNVTQNFYAATTQLMFDDSSLNRTRLSSLQHQNTTNRNSQDIHDAATQVAVYPSSITDREVEISNVIVESVNDDIHNAPTQVIMNIHDAPTQVIIFSPRASTSKASQNSINQPAEAATSPESVPQNNQEVDIHEMATQAVLYMPDTIDDNQKQIEENHQNQSKLDESTTPIAKPGVSNKPNDAPFNPIPKVEDSFIHSETHVNSSVIQDSIIEETVIEENEVNLRNIENEAVINENSNDSMDFLSMQQPFEAGITQANDNADVTDDKNSCGSDSEIVGQPKSRKLSFSESNTNVTDDKNSTVSDSQGIGQPKRKVSRKLSSSEDLSEPQNLQKTYNSDSETDIDDSDNIRGTKKKNLQKRQAQMNKVCNSDSETDIEDDIPKVNKKQPLNDSDTDIEDDKLDLTQSEDIVKPKILARKSIFSSDSETDVEDNKKQEPVLEAARDKDNSETEILNDTDYIPATQDAFANMFQYTNPKSSNSNHNSQNASSEESFKLGLTELMIDGEENNQSNNEVSKDESKDVDQKDEKVADDLPTENICKKDGLMATQKLMPKTANDSSKMVSVVPKNTDEDLYTMATQKIDEGKLDAQELAKNIINEPRSIPSTSKMVTNIENVADEDELYMMPTQKIEESDKLAKKINELNNLPSTSKMVTNIEKELDEDFYMLPTQKIDNFKHEFKAPAKKFTFKKKATHLEGSFTNILGSKEKEDPSLMATQQINETEDNNEDDIYMQATQKLENNSEREHSQRTHNDEKNALYTQPTQDLNLVGPNTSEKEENPFMGPTQQINQDAINEMYDLETQKLDSQSNLDSVKLACNDHVSKDDLYDLPTQPLSTLESDLPPRCTVGNIEANSSENHLVVTNQDSPKRKITKKSDIESLKRTIQSSHIDGFVKEPADDIEKVETLSQIEAFVKKPFENPREQNSPISKIVKEEGQLKELDKTKIEAPVKNKKLLDSALTKDVLINQREEEEIDRPETLSQIDAFVKKPLELATPRSKKISQIEANPSSSRSKGNESMQKRKENGGPNQNAIAKTKTRTPRTRQSTKPSEEDLYMAPTQEINQDPGNEKINVSGESSKVSEKDLYVAVNKDVSNNALYMLETEKIDSQSDFYGFSVKDLSNTAGTDDIPQSNKRPSPSALDHKGGSDIKESANNLEVTNSDIPKRKRMKKSDIENLKKTIGSKDKVDIDRPETLSQIEAFIKSPVDVKMPKPRKLQIIEVKPSTSSSENKFEITDTIIGLMKDVGEIEKPEKLTRTSRTRQYTKHFEEENIKETNKASAKPEPTNLQESTAESAETLEIQNVSANRNLSSDTIRTDVDQSFALLEAKSTKTRKSKRITDVGEIKVAACKNRRSMTTTSIPEFSKTTAELKPSTRRSRKVTVNNNIVATALETKIGDRSKQITGRGITAKRKPDTSDTDFSESEVPAKMIKANIARKGKAKASVKDINKMSTVSEESTKDIDRAVKASVTRRGKGTAAVIYESDQISSTSEESSKDFELPTGVLKTPVARKGKGRAAVKDESYTTFSASGEGNRDKEPATPTTSRARINSRSTISKSTGDGRIETKTKSALGQVMTTPSRRGKKNVLHDELLNTPERLKRKQRPKVVFTMLDNPQLESLIRQLGGSVVDSVDTSTVLVTEHVKRSQKLLTAVGQGKPICSPSWIRESKKANEFLDPWDFILVDKEAESKWNFSLKESISKAANEKLLINYSFLLLVSNAVDVLKGAIESCGGKCVTRNPPKNAEGFYVVVSSPENKNKYSKIKKQHPEVIVVEPEAIFDGVLRQDLRLGRHLLT